MCLLSWMCCCGYSDAVVAAKRPTEPQRPSGGVDLLTVAVVVRGGVGFAVVISDFRVFASFAGDSGSLVAA